MLTDIEVSFKKNPQTVEWRTEKIFCFWYEQLVGKQRYEGLKLLLRHSDCECFLHKCFIERLLQAWLIFSSTGIKLLLPPNYCIPFDKIVIIYMMLCHVLDVHPIFFSNLLFKLHWKTKSVWGGVTTASGISVTGSTIQTSPATFWSGRLGPQSSTGRQGLSWHALQLFQVPGTPLSPSSLEQACWHSSEDIFLRDCQCWILISTSLWLQGILAGGFYWLHGQGDLYKLLWAVHGSMGVMV